MPCLQGRKRNCGTARAKNGPEPGQGHPAGIENCWLNLSTHCDLCRVPLGTDGRAQPVLLQELPCLNRDAKAKLVPSWGQIQIICVAMRMRCRVQKPSFFLLADLLQHSCGTENGFAVIVGCGFYLCFFLVCLFLYTVPYCNQARIKFTPASRELGLSYHTAKAKTFVTIAFRFFLSLM